jgi:DNA-binding NarL/FixJ family response regulator
MTAVVEDHPLVRKGVVALLDAEPDLTVAEVSVSGEDAVARAAEVRPDVVLMDLQLPGMSGIEATRAIVAADPDVRVLVLTSVEDEDSVFLALRAGARGHVLKDADGDELTGAIRAVARGEAIFSQTVAGRVLAFFATLQVADRAEAMLRAREAGLGSPLPFGSALPDLGDALGEGRRLGAPRPRRARPGGRVEDVGPDRRPARGVG